MMRALAALGGAAARGGGDGVCGGAALAQLWFSLVWTNCIWFSLDYGVVQFGVVCR